MGHLRDLIRRVFQAVVAGGTRHSSLGPIRAVLARLAPDNRRDTTVDTFASPTFKQRFASTSYSLNCSRSALVGGRRVRRACIARGTETSGRARNGCLIRVDVVGLGCPRRAVLNIGTSAWATAKRDTGRGHESR